VIGVCDGPGEPGTVVRQLRPGYMWKDQVLQPAEVITVAGAST
jgi:molecular chaperone GrpE (heat shock protein)